MRHYTETYTPDCYRRDRKTNSAAQACFALQRRIAAEGCDAA
jgi:hypothetical protein